MAKQYKDHKSVPAKYKWDLSFLLEGKTVEQRIDEIISAMQKQIATKDSKYETKKAYLDSLIYGDELSKKYYKLINYLTNSSALNVVDPEVTALMQKLQFEEYKISQEMGPESTRFYANIKKIKEYIKDDKAFDPYRKDIEAAIDDEKHDLPKAVKDYRNVAARGDMNVSELFEILTNSELNYGFATTSKGKKIKLNPAIRTKMAKHNDKMVRKTASLSYRNAYLNHKESLSAMLYQQFKRWTVDAKVKKFKSTIDMALHGDRYEEGMLLNLYEAVQKNVPSMKKFDNWFKKFYKAKYGETITKYDYSRDLVKTKGEYSPEDAMEMVIKSTKPFGEEYNGVVKQAMKENWVDFMNIKNKRSGAYSIGASYGLDKKLILMNFEGTFNSVETLAHEVGHSMHSYMSDKHNPISQANYPIFVAEVASIFNELMLFDSVLSTSKDDKLKFEILQSTIQGFSGTVFRQVQWSNYEYDMYKAIEEGQPIGTYDAISKLYYANAQKYTTKKKKYKAEEQFAGIYVPHFYYGFYVYKYAIGQLVANIFFAKYKEEGKEALQTYIKKFLSAGSTDWPVQVLKNAGVDLADPKTLEMGFKPLEENINEWIKVGKRIFKNKL